MFYTTLDYLRTLVGKFGKSVGPKVELKAHSQLLMLGFVKTRWWSEWLMAERVLAIRKADCEALNKVKASYGWTDVRKIKDEDYKLVRYYVEFFSVMKQKSDILAAEDTCTLHLVHSCVKGIRKQITKYENNETIGGFVRDFDTEFSK